MKIFQLILPTLAVIAFAADGSAREKEELWDTKSAFIQYQYLVVGGGLTEGPFYRAKLRVFKEKGKLMIERIEGKKIETVELIKEEEEEQLTTWEADFKEMKLSISYVMNVHHGNFPFLVGEGSRTLKNGEVILIAETALPDFSKLEEAK